MQRGAIIGLGNVALHGHLPGWRRRRDVEIVAVTDARPEQHALVSAHAPGAHWYTTSAELLAEASVDFVDICTPPSSHAPLIRLALERGRHVLCEKPLVSAPDDLAPLARLAEKTGRVLHTVHNWHHAPIVRRTAELIRDGRIGRVEHVIWHTLRTRLAVSAADVGRLASPGLVRRGREPVPRRDDRRSAARGEPRRGAALRGARARGARVESTERPRDLRRGSPDLTTAVAVSVRSAESLLLVVPPEPGTATSVSPGIVVAGLPLLRRIVLAGSRAGFSRVLVQISHGDAERLLGGTAAGALSGARLPDSRRRIVILPANVVPQPRWLRALRE